MESNRKLTKKGQIITKRIYRLNIFERKLKKQKSDNIKKIKEISIKLKLKLKQKSLENKQMKRN
jgi:hypothetical protein